MIDTSVMTECVELFIVMRKAASYILVLVLYLYSYSYSYSVDRECGGVRARWTRVHRCIRCQADIVPGVDAWLVETADLLLRLTVNGCMHA